MSTQQLNPPSEGPKTYSPFWPIFIVLTSFVAMEILYLKTAWEQQSRLRASLTEINTTVTHANTVEKLLEGIGKDLAELAPRNAEASKIVKEFQIRYNPSAPRAAAPTNNAVKK